MSVGLYLFQPWKLFTSSTLDEALPAGVTSELAPTSTDTPVPSSAAPTSAPPAQPSTLAAGDFVSQEHPTKGKATVHKLADGSRVLRLTGLASSDGPDLHIWLTDQSAGGEWGKYDDGRYVKLGKLKATHGNQNYAIPAEAKLDGLRSVVIWCDRFNVAFGSAPLTL
ncbi:DM13 domain-containing protein [Crossiella sp. CA198]|uniref:DM13 domain-containing protein n=1 Tax=Crossiella sp. CA198 TaxID=3455607 RepID=UPI003F8D52DC